MRKKLSKIINTYGVIPQLEYYQSEAFELDEAIIIYENERPHCDDEADAGYIEMLKQHIAEELADNYVMLYQFPEYYYERLEYHNIAPYEFKTDNYECIEDISKYLKDLQKNDICKLTCAIAIAEEREQNEISEYRYENLISIIDNIFYKLKSIQLHYKISDGDIEKVMKFKIERQLRRIEGSSNE